MAIELSITDEQLLVIDQGLQELPFRIAAPVIAAINEQLRAIRLADLDYHPGPAARSTKPRGSARRRRITPLLFTKGR